VSEFLVQGFSGLIEASFWLLPRRFHEAARKGPIWKKLLIVSAMLALAIIVAATIIVLGLIVVGILVGVLRAV
jgi:uncharacterized membrane protein YhaH (DUF805 family)